MCLNHTSLFMMCINQKYVGRCALSGPPPRTLSLTSTNSECFNHSERKYYAYTTLDLCDFSCATKGQNTFV